MSQSVQFPPPALWPVWVQTSTMTQTSNETHCIPEQQASSRHAEFIVCPKNDVAWKELFVRNEQQNIDCLDGVRALAVLWVIVFHSWSSLASSWAHAHLSDAEKAVYYNSPTLWIARSGELGVDVFFVLSGFLIGYLLFRECEDHDSINVALFMQRRVLRIYPAMLVFVVIALSVVFSAGRVADGSWMLLSLVFLNNLAGPALNGAHLWSLAVEFQFYLFSPLLITAMHRSTRPLLLATVPIVASCVLSAVLVVVYFPSATHDPKVWQDNFDLYNRVLYTKPHTRVGPYLCGMVAAACHRRASHLGDLYLAACLEWAAVVSAGVFCMVGGNPAYASFLSAPGRVVLVTCGRTLFGVFLSFLLLRSLDPHRSSLSPFRPARWIHSLLSSAIWRPVARLSFSAYLWHVPALLLVSSALPPLPLPVGPNAGVSADVMALARVSLTFFAAIPLTFFLASLSFFGVEKRFVDQRPPRHRNERDLFELEGVQVHADNDGRAAKTSQGGHVPFMLLSESIAAVSVKVTVTQPEAADSPQTDPGRRSRSNWDSPDQDEPRARLHRQSDCPGTVTEREAQPDSESPPGPCTSDSDSGLRA